MHLHVLGFYQHSIVTSPLLLNLVKLEEVISEKVYNDWGLNIIIILIIVYNRRGYISLVSREAETSMVRAIEEVRALPSFPTNGEVSCGLFVITKRK